MAEFTEIQAAYYMVAATGVLVAAVYYVLNMRANSKARQAQMFMGIYERFNTPEAIDSSIRLLNLKVKDFDEFHRLLNESNADGRSLNWYSAYYEGLGVLVREKFIDIRLVSLLMYGELKWFWEKYGSYWRQYRVAESYPRAMVEGEFLYDSVMEYGKKHLGQG